MSRRMSSDSRLCGCPDFTYDEQHRPTICPHEIERGLRNIARIRAQIAARREGTWEPEPEEEPDV